MTRHEQPSQSHMDVFKFSECDEPVTITDLFDQHVPSSTDRA